MGVLGKSTGASGAPYGGTRYKSAGVWRGGGSLCGVLEMPRQFINKN